MEYLNDPFLVKNHSFYDHRGIFVPLSLDSNLKWLQSNISINPKKFTLRGLHFQIYPYNQSKLIKVIDGSIIDFIANIDKKDKDYLKIKIFKMNPGNELYVPKNYAHGFLTLESNTIVQYLVDNIYSPKSEGVIPWTFFSELEEEFNKIKNFSKDSLIIKDQDLVLKNFSY